MTGNKKILAIICDGSCIIFDGETKISTGKQQKQGGESALNSNLAGKHIFLAGHPFSLAGQHFSGIVTGGCVMRLSLMLCKQIVVFLNFFGRTVILHILAILQILAIMQEKSTKSLRQKLLFYSGARTWNEIPLEIRMSPTITMFKRKLKEFLQN